MNSFVKKIKKNRSLLIMLLPAVLYVTIFSYIPMTGIIIAFKKYNYQAGILGSKWAGFDNFRYMILSNKLWPLTRNTLLYNIVFISLGLVCEVGFAIILNEITRKKFKKISQTMMFLPHFISWVVVATIVLNIFGDHGVLNNLLGSMGMDSFNIYSKAKEWPIVMVLMRLWKNTGYGCVVYLAAIVGISPEIYEAAKIDGANIWQRIWNITLPCLKPTIITMVLLAIGGIFRGDFGMFYQLVGNNQILLETSDILDTFIYRSMMSTSNLGMTAAAGLYQSVLCFITINLVNYTIKKIDPDYALY
ncbi:ABC transporter permease [Butyrivibrio fibrisolvens]|uniref:ABC transporter permease n=1 Tax=Butyrivibrio fibrisolvens TaxID=831 RepID=UPI00040E5F06|nr:ABC transporter permease subunit [Butyrivibrio fibrisolvens]